MGDIDGLLSIEPPPIQAGADDGIRVIGLGLAGRRDEARRALERMRQQRRIPAFLSWIDYLAAWLDKSMPGMSGRMGSTSSLKIQDDPEAVFQEGWLFCDIGEHRTGLEYLKRGVAKGYYVIDTLRSRSQFDPLREDPEFTALTAAAEAGRDRALAAFREAGGDRLLGS
jgi:CheY-like chemotaxis protein